MKFAQIHYFLSQNVGGDKKYYVPPVQKLGGTCPSCLPINSVPDQGYTQYNVIVANANWLKKLVKQGLGLILSMFPYAYKLKNKFQLEEEGIGNIFLWGFRSGCSSRLHKIS